MEESKSKDEVEAGKSYGETDKHVDEEPMRADLLEVVERHSLGLDERRPEAVARRQEKNQRMIRVNIRDLCDGNFIEYGALAVAAQRQRRSMEDLMSRTPADGVVAGIGSVNSSLFGEDKARCMVIAYDYTVLAGTQGFFGHKKKDRMLRLAHEQRLPVVLFAEGGGGRPGDVDADGVMVAGLDITTFAMFAKLSGKVPVVGIVSGRCFAGNAVLLGCCDVIIAAKNTNIGMAGPVMIEGGGLGVFKPEDIGPMDVQTNNGVVDIAVADDAEAVAVAKKFSSLIVFAILWFTIVYCPVAHWVWGSGGWLVRLGALDFAGGTVVHISAGMSALALAICLGSRKGFLEKEPMEPSNIPIVVLGAGLLWFGWFGFNAGSALTSGGLAASAFVATNTSAAAAAFTWMLISWIYRRPTVLGTATGAVVGLVAITPAAGFVSPVMGIPIGFGAAVVCYYTMLLRAKKMGVDESLDVWACHGMGGIWGALATGIFTSVAVNTAGVDGLVFGNALQLAKQLLAVVSVGSFAFGATLGLGKLVDVIIGLRVSPTEEVVGLDISQHGERAYGGTLR